MTTNENNIADNFFQYEITFALNHEKIKKYPLKITKICPFLYQYEWKGIIFLYMQKT